MKKILITLGIIILLLGMVGGVIIYNKHNGSEIVNGDSNIENEEIEICDIFEYGDYVYYILPDSNLPYNYNAICKMKRDGSNKEIIVDASDKNHTMRIYNNYIFDNNLRINLDTNEEKTYLFDSIEYMSKDLMIYVKDKGFGVVRMSDIDNWDFDKNLLKVAENRQDWSILYANESMIVYSVDNKIYRISPDEVIMNKQSKFLKEEGQYTKVLLEQDNEIYLITATQGNVHLYSLHKDTLELKLIMTDFFEADILGREDIQTIGSIAIKDEIILYTIGSYQGSAGMWCGSTRKINKDGSNKEILEEFNESEEVKNIEGKLYYRVWSQESGGPWIEYENGISKKVDNFYSVEKIKYRFSAESDNVVISKFDGNEYKKCITIPKRNEDLDFVEGEVKECGDWLYVYLYERDFNGSSWRGFKHLEFYRISKDYKVVQALDDNYVVKNPYSKILSLNNVRLKNDLNVRIKLSFVPYGNNVDLNKGITSGKYVIETFCQANENADKLEIENVQFSSQQANLIFDDYDFDKNPDFIFEYTNASNATENMKYEISENAKLENIKKVEEVAKNIKIEEIPVGSYIAYRPSQKSYNVLSEDSGVGWDQGFNPSDTITWKVFKNNNGQLDIISEESIGNLRLRGITGYINVVDTLNKLCMEYVNPQYADSGRSLGYIDGESIKRLDNEKYSISYDSLNSKDKLEFPYTDETYIADQSIINTSIDENWDGIEEYPLRHSGGNIWLASRWLKELAGFEGKINVLNFDGSESQVALFSLFPSMKDMNSEYLHDSSNGVRPIVSLKSSLKITSGDGTRENPYRISI